MSRLIDADKLIQELKNLAKGQISSCPNIAEFFVSIRVDRIINILNSQPTAFDVEQVVSELEDYKMWKELLIYDLNFRERQIIKKAIDIVKARWNR